jgi:alkylation response protein AidB-like acyl-CoA dehydrogenase
MSQEAGYLKLPLPREYGGDEISLYQLVLIQERLAQGDGSTALAVGWHMGIMLHLRHYREWPERLFARFCQEVVEEGALINKFETEPATSSPSRGGKPRTIAVKTEGGWLLTGRKTFSTLSPILNTFIASASIDGEERIGQFFVRKSAGVRLEETWDTLGMRATGSHDLIMERAFVPDEALIRTVEPGERHTLNRDTGWLLHIPACYLGIARAAREYALHYASTYQPGTLAEPIASLPHIQAQIGRLEAEWRTARTLLYSVAQRWDEYPQERNALKADLGLAKYVATNHALSIVDQAMRIVGGSSLYRNKPLERLYRDVRAGLHNPPMDDVVIRNLAWKHCPLFPLPGQAIKCNL